MKQRAVDLEEIVDEMIVLIALAAEGCKGDVG
jgi:hypothetical protein